MTWIEHHITSEQYASEAEMAARLGEHTQARELYRIAAQSEDRALHYLDPDKMRTYGITAVSAVALYFKAAQWDTALTLAYRCLGSGRLPKFAWHQLEDLLESIKMEQAGIGSDTSQIVVSLRGGEIVRGGAPLDLIIAKAEKMKALVYRTTEYMKEIPHRRRGEPSEDIRNSYRPWLFQAEPGSYQFAVSVQKTRQLKLDLFDTDISPEEIVAQLFGILRACVESPMKGLPEVVPDDDYGVTFLKLTRDLTPSWSERRFTHLEIRAVNSEHRLILNSDTRYTINDVIKERRPSPPNTEEVEIRGVLRALHLDNDWIEIVSDGEKKRIDRASDKVDDRIGPMVNHRVVVRVIKEGEKLYFLDIETVD